MFVKDASQDMAQASCPQVRQSKGRTRLRFHRQLVTILTSLAIISGPALGHERIRPSEAGMSAVRLERVSEITDKYVAGGSLSGAVTIVYRKGHVAHVLPRG